ncbi:MAG: glycoside hydrolase family 53 protein [Ginsengibacter sp.]
MKIFFIFIFFIGISISFSCKKNSDTSRPRTDTLPNDTIPHVDTLPANNTFFAKGADVSWLTQMESQGLNFYDKSGTQKDLFQILKDEGMNSIRLRIWVNPPGNYNNTADVVSKAIRAKNAGMKIMIDFHYSDTWADPGHQEKPATWSGTDISVLQDSLYNHTLTVLNTLKSNNVIPTWVQVGNETNDGMLWPEGKASTNMANFAALITSGYNAVKAVDTSIKVIVHISNGYDNGLFRWIFDGLKTNGAKWDIIGMSLYPDAGNWNTLNLECFTNMSDMVSRYNKPVMISEVGMSWTDSVACNSFIKDLITKTKSITGNKGLGVFYWEPEAYNNWQGYSLGAFDNSGKPTLGLDAFK